MKNADKDKLEVWDGGHCYLRILFNGREGVIKRWPRVVSISELKFIHEWMENFGIKQLATEVE